MHTGHSSSGAAAEEVLRQYANPTDEGTTHRVIRLTTELSWNGCPDHVRHSAVRHLLDTMGVMIAGSTSLIVAQAEAMLAELRSPGNVPVPGRARRADILDAAYLAGAAGHGIELDDGYRQGSIHPAVCVIPAALFAAYRNRVSGKELLEAIIVGYEVMAGLAQSYHPGLRRRGFHPTGVLGVFGAAAAAARLYRMSEEQIANAYGIAASSGAGLFAFINGGADIKRLHAGHAAREGLQAALLARRGVAGPPGVIEGRDGFAQAYIFGQGEQSIPIFPPAADFRITDCYIKPYACCRHLQPAVEALIELLEREKIAEDEIRDVRVETYAISAEHAHTGWGDYASAQLSFPYIMALGIRFRQIKIRHFEDGIRLSSDIASLCKLVRVEVAPDLDAGYPELRPARVTVTTDRGIFRNEALEALGSKQIPFDDARLGEKFMEMAEMVFPREQARALLDNLWNVASCDDIAPLVDQLSPRGN